MAATTQFTIEMRASSEQLRADLDKGKRIVVSSASDMAGAFARAAETASGFLLAQAGIAGFTGVFEAAKAAVIDFNTTLQSAQRSFTFLGDGAEAATEHMAALARVAEETPFPTKDFFDASRALQGIGIAAERVPDLLRQIANAAVVAKTGVADATQAVGRFIAQVSSGQGAGLAIRQLFSQNLVRADTVAQIRALEAAGADANTIIMALLKSFDRFGGASIQAANQWDGLTVRIKDRLSDLAGTGFAPFFTTFESLARGLATALNTDEAERAMHEFGLAVFDTTAEIVVGIVRLWETVQDIWKGIRDFWNGPEVSAGMESYKRSLQDMIDLWEHLKTAVEAAKLGMSAKDFIFSDPAAMKKFVDANKAVIPVELGPPSPSAAQKLQSTILEARENAERAWDTRQAARAATAGGAGGGGPLMAAVPPTQEMVNAVEEAKRILASLDPSATAADKALLSLAQRFTALEKAAGTLRPQVQAIAQKAFATAQAAEFLKAWDAMIASFNAADPTLTGLLKQFDDIDRQYAVFAKTFSDPEMKQAAFEKGQALQALILEQANFKASIEELDRVLAEESDADRAWAEALAPIDDLLKRIRVSSESFSRDLEGSIRSASNLRGAGLGGPTAGEAAQTSTEARIAALQRERVEINQAMALVQEYGEEWDRLVQGIQRVDAELITLTASARGLQSSNTAAKFATDMEVIKQSAIAIGSSYDVIGARIARVVQEIDALIAAGNKAESASVAALSTQLKQLETQKQIAEAIGSSIQITLGGAADAMVDAFVRGKAAAIDWGQVVEDILAAVVRQLIEVLIIQTLVKAAMGAITGTGGSSGIFIGGAMPTGAMAGGVVTGPTTLLVGEAGPEAIIPLSKFDFGGVNRGGGGDVNITIIDQRKDGGEITTRDTSTGNRRQFEVLIKDAVRRGLTSGEYDRVLTQFFGVNRQAAGR